MTQPTKRQQEHEELIASTRESFSAIPDPRVARTRKHPLDTILVMSMLAILSSADSFVAIEMWGRANKDWLSTFLDMRNGVPSHDTIGRLFAALDPNALASALAKWARALAGELTGKVVALDGKTLRRAIGKANGDSFVHMVNAWATEQGVALGQLRTNAKSNEITAIPELLDTLDVKGATVTIDAMGCQKGIAGKIKKREADYVIAVKDNQPTLSSELQRHLKGHGSGRRPLAFHETVEHAHGRSETRRCWLSTDVGDLSCAAEWPGLAAILRVESIREEGGVTTTHDRYFISSRADLTAAKGLEIVRSHWGIENELHWVLDVAFREDDSRVRVRNAAENFSRMRQMALNLLKAVPNAKVGIKNRRLRAGWDKDFLLQVLGAGR